LKAVLVGGAVVAVGLVAAVVLFSRFEAPSVGGSSVGVLAI
jgi:hypothetical protein